MNKLVNESSTNNYQIKTIQEIILYCKDCKYNEYILYGRVFCRRNEASGRKGYDCCSMGELKE